jgi:hypothetical protein
MCGWPAAQNFLAGCTLHHGSLWTGFVKDLGGGRRTGRLLPSWIAMPDGAWWVVSSRATRKFASASPASPWKMPALMLDRYIIWKLFHEKSIFLQRCHRMSPASF